MLGWLTGSTPQDHNTTYLEPPETPAPVFAVRAFKTALFGTPHPTEDEEPEKTRDLHIEAARDKRARPHPRSDKTQSSNRVVTTESHPLPSPTKGILLTPGTPAQRRKTVSFGAAVGDDKRVKSSNVSQTGLPIDFPGKYPSPWISNAGKQGSQRQTALTRSFCNVRDEKVPKHEEGQAVIAAEGAQMQEAGQSRNISLRHGIELERDQDPDVTLDVSEPRSQSGQHWKREYEHYDKKTRHEMKKLVKYRRMAKSYAMKKDAEATELSEKLRHERAKVARMEDEVSRLAAQMVSGPGSPEQAQAMKALSKQTALALEYKRKVDQFEAALGQYDRRHPQDEYEGAETYQSSLPEKGPTMTSLDRILAREQLEEMEDLRTEMDVLRRSVSAAENKAATLVEENTTLKDDLAKLKEEMDQFEARRTIKEKLQNQKVEKLETEKEELKKSLAKSKEEHGSFRASHLKGSAEEKLSVELLPVDSQHHHRKTLRELRQAREEASTLRLKVDAMRQELEDSKAEVRRLQRSAKSQEPRIKKEQAIDIWSAEFADNKRPRSSGRASAIAPPSRLDNLDRPKEAALSDIGVNRSNEHLPRGPATPESVASPKHDSSFVHPWDASNASSALPELPSPEPFTISPRKSSRPRYRTTGSLRRSLLSVASSPPKFESMSLPLNTAVPVSTKPPYVSKGKAEKHQHELSTASVSGGRPSVSMEGRSGPTLLPPERVAAAKARLAQRNAERKRVHESEKENM